MATALGEYLRARRAQVLPEDVGVPTYGVRRVPGLRREELAMLARVSVDYYVRLEQGTGAEPRPRRCSTRSATSSSSTTTRASISTRSQASHP